MASGTIKDTLPTNKFNANSETPITLPYTATNDRELLVVTVVLSSQQYSGMSIFVNGVNRLSFGAMIPNMPLSCMQSMELFKGDVVTCKLNGYGETVSASIFTK